MRFTRVKLTNWKNFREVDVNLPLRAFLIGPNASGKSNFLDAFRFLRDLALPGGLHKAVEERGGIQKLRCLQARNPADVGIEVEIEDENKHVTWTYKVVFSQEGTFPRQTAPIIKKELVLYDHQEIISRPDQDDSQDRRLLEQTALEQISLNREFRDIAEYFENISYLHLVPQIIRSARGLQIDPNLPDIYGGRFLETVASTKEGRRKRLLRQIQEALSIAVPQLSELALVKDAGGRPHLEARYEHWRPNAGRQDENQFSDGTLRLIGLLWALLDGNGLLLMEEPELSLHQGIVRQLAPFIHKAQTKPKASKRQVFISTHSVDLLSDPGIGAEEVILFSPGHNGTEVRSAAGYQEIVRLMEEGLTAADAALPATEDVRFLQLRLFNL